VVHGVHATYGTTVVGLFHKINTLVPIEQRSYQCDLLNGLKQHVYDSYECACVTVSSLDPVSDSTIRFSSMPTSRSPSGRL